MHFVDRHREKIRQSPMSSRLLWACLLLVVLLVLTFGAALFLFASLHNTKKDISRSLQIQFSVFQNDMERYFDQLAVMGVNLSEDMSAEVDKELALRQMSFAQLNDSPEVLNALEEEMIEPLCRRLRQTGCSGAFVLLDATVNTRMEGAEHSRAGLYVQKSGADTPTVPLLLYRGSAEVGKAHSVMPHRKWRMEFQTDQFPDYDRWMTPGSVPLYQSYTLTERFELPGMPWGKVYRRELFAQVRFPAYYTCFEDAIIHFLVFRLAKTVASVPEMVYLWRKNPKGLTATSQHHPAAVQSYWIMEQLAVQDAALGLPHDALYRCTLTLQLSAFCYATVSGLPPETQQAVFRLCCALYAKALPQEGALPRRARWGARALRQQDFGLWCRYGRRFQLL